MVPWEKPTQRQVGLDEVVALEQLVEIVVEQWRRPPGAGEHNGRPAILQAEPLATVRCHVAGLGRVRCHEQSVRQPFGQQRGEADQIVAVRADAVQQHDELSRWAACSRGDGRAGKLRHVVLDLWYRRHCAG